MDLLWKRRADVKDSYEVSNEIEDALIICDINQSSGILGPRLNICLIKRKPHTCESPDCK